MDITEKVGIITGGGGGLGAAAAEMLTRKGGKAVIVDLPSSPGAELADRIGTNALFVPTDITSTDQVTAAIDAAVDHFGRVDILINSAGISPAARVLNRRGELFPLDVFERTLAVNLVGPFDVIRQAALIMSKNDAEPDGEKGIIINVSSAAATEGQKGQASYTASKGAIAALTLQLARDLADVGIRVNAVSPGIMDTPMLAGIDEARRAALLDLHTFPKRLGTGEDFARLVEAMIEISIINGEVVRLDAATRMGG